VSAQTLNQIKVWSEGMTTPTRILSNGLSQPLALVVTITGDIYVDNSWFYGRIDRWAPNTTISVPEMYVTCCCYGLFIDINDTFYCAIYTHHQVIKWPVNSGSYTSTIIIGTGSSGSASNMLNTPYSVFVDNDFNVFVADYGNNRIQKFLSGQSNGTTVASAPFTLNGPTGIVLDGNGYLFIVEKYNYRIIGSGPSGFRCLAGCSGSSGSAPNQLYLPHLLSFDSYGNMFVTDWGNGRVQNFHLETNLCGKHDSIYEVH
jgi:hypothetical protein